MLNYMVLFLLNISPVLNIIIGPAASSISQVESMLHVCVFSDTSSNEQSHMIKSLKEGLSSYDDE
jgi:hypothetical protein